MDCYQYRTQDGKIGVKVYRKATHADQHLQFDSNHPLQHKLGVVRTLHHRAKSIVTDSAELEKEIDHVNTALKINGYQQWAINMITTSLCNQGIM